MNTLQNERFMLSPCRELYHYMMLKKGYEASDADALVRKYARSALARNAEISELSLAKMFEAIKKDNN
ncbi:hypothetical protein BME96_18550 [Virgibacillus halodenitrificans]|uniref:Uncharacterized protein n=1 Tax=Virgibacillus halodenitrificans TaxID=1482 RepID=A0AAC9J1Z0_VIRHA|nr:hypothetical protein [Virgibacillus halodenitrificans]APC50076.1 hypothetical protein BME96_18550 [Virgibacillus halodenitrificans]